MYGFPLTLLIALLFGVVVGLASYFFYFKKTDAPKPVKKAAIMAGIVFILVIVIGLITE